MIQAIAIGVLLVGVVSFVGIGWHKYNSAIEGKVAAEGKLASCNTKYATLDGRVGEQNVALDQLRGERDKAQKKAEDALRDAAKAEAGRAGERARAENLEKNFRAVGPCPADQAVAKAKEGLKP